MSDADRLLDYIVRTRVQPLDRQQAELTANADNNATLPAEIERRTADDEAAAADLAAAFATGLERAAARPGTPLELDDRQPEEDRIADALIRFLVTPNLAAVTSEETEAGHYRYQVMIDWGALTAVAYQAGVALPEPAA